MAWAQGPVDAGIRGRVVDAYGGRAPRARVQVRSISGPDGLGAEVVKREFEAGGDGGFVLLRLPPGEYAVQANGHYSAQAMGMARVRVEAGELVDVTVSLGGYVGAVGDSVTELGVSETVTEAVLAELPVESGAWEQVGELDSGANVAATAGRAVGGAGEGEEDDEDAATDRAGSEAGAAATGLSFGGMAAIQDGVSVDGLSGGQGFRSGPRGAAGGGASAGASFGQGAVRSLRVMPRSFSAEYSGGVGGRTEVASQAAEGAMHGSAFVMERESAWAATNPFSIQTHYRDGVVTTGVVKPAGSVLQFGVAVGAPFGRERRERVGLVSSSRLGTSQKRFGEEPAMRAVHRVTLFGSVEGELRSDTIVSTPAMAGFYALTAEQVALLGNRGVTAVARNAALNFLDSLTGTTARRATRLLSFGRVDWAPGKEDRVTFGYVGNRFDAPAGAALGRASNAVVARGRGSLGSSLVNIDAGTGRWLRMFSPRWSNEVRGQVAHDLEYETPGTPLPQEPGIGPGGYAPEVSIAPNGFAYGTPTNLGRTAWPDETRIEGGDTMQVLLGGNLLKMGMDWSRLDDRIASVANAEGEFLYDSGSTNGKDGGLVDWMTDYTFNVTAYPNGGCPSIVAKVHDFCFRSFTQGFGGTQTEFVTHEFGGFVEDEVRPRVDLTVTLGVRWEYTLLPLPQAPNYGLDAALKTISSPNVGLTSVLPEDRNNFGPRLAAAWSPRGFGANTGGGGKSLFTVRVGYGAFFGRIPGATVRAALVDTAQAATSLHIRIRPTTETLCPQITAINQGFGYPCAYVATPPATVVQTSSATVFAERFRVPVVQRASFEVEREFGRKVLVKAGYQTATATQLPGSTDLNVAASTALGSFVLQGGDAYPGLHTGETFVVPVYSVRPMPQFGPVTAVVSNANATYHAGTVEVRARDVSWLRGMEVRGSYTFSRAIDYAPQSSAVPRVDGQFDPFANGYDKGLSSLQFPQRFAGNLIYATRFAGGPEWVRKALSGWRVAAIATTGSGAPYSYNVFGGTYLAGGRETLNGSGGAAYLPTVGRNTLRLPPRASVDLRLGREFGVGPRVKVSAFGEAFNLLNTRNLAGVETRAFLVGTPGFAGGPTPLVFQDAATIASEGLSTPAFGTATSSTTGVSRERQVACGVRVQF